MSADELPLSRQPLIRAGHLALAVDLYELTMLQAYRQEGLHGPAVFSLFFRELPQQRRLILACGQEELVRRLPELRFDDEVLAALREVPGLHPEFVEGLRTWRFSGDVYAVPEGTPVFPQEPILEVHAPLPEAQLLETLVLNQVHVQSVLASKALRMRLAAGDKRVIDFSMRRAQGVDAAVSGVRAFWIAGLDATSNVLGGLRYGVPVAGTMAHSLVQAHDNERAAFEAFLATTAEPTLLVDTYDTLAGVDQAIALAREQGCRLGAVRLDSGDLLALSRETRRRLDDAGLHEVRIFASGGLDEHRIEGLRSAGAPVDGFGVGTSLGVSQDAPALELVDELVELDGQPRAKRSTGKRQLPGPKQVLRLEDGAGRFRGDRLLHRDERFEQGTPLLRRIMHRGEPLEERLLDLQQAREHCRTQVAALPDACRSLAPGASGYPVEISPRLLARTIHEGSRS